MNKSKFKTVKFLPLNRFLHEENACFWRDVGMNHDIMFEEKFIENNGTLFEVEKVEREFEEGAWYKARYSQGYEWEVIRFYEGYGFMRVGLMGYKPRERFFEIGEKIEL